MNVGTKRDAPESTLAAAAVTATKESAESSAAKRTKVEEPAAPVESSGSSRQLGPVKWQVWLGDTTMIYAVYANENSVYVGDESGRVVQISHKYVSLASLRTSTFTSLRMTDASCVV